MSIHYGDGSVIRSIDLPSPSNDSTMVCCFPMVESPAVKLLNTFSHYNKGRPLRLPTLQRYALGHSNSDSSEVDSSFSACSPESSPGAVNMKGSSEPAPSPEGTPVTLML